MSDVKGASGKRLDDLTKQVMLLNTKVEQLSERLAAIENGPAISRKSGNPSMLQVQAKPQERVLVPVDGGTLLPRIAAICFLLVIALILRTITDNQIIDTQVGSLLGMAYAAILIASGWWLYENKSRFSPVFPGCGLLLLFSIVLETHARYESLSTVWAYSVLLVAGFMAVVMSLRYQAVALTCLGIIGTTVIGMTIDFPYPSFPFLGVLLLAANIAAFRAFQQQMCRFLQWTMLGFTIIFWSLWSFKLNLPPACDEPIAKLLHLGWFFPILFLFLAVYFSIVVLSTLKSELPQGFFESLLPTISSVGAFWAGRAVVEPWFENKSWFGIIAMLFAVVHFFLAWRLAKRDKAGATGSNAFTFAGVCLFVLASTATVKNTVWIVPVWSVMAYFLALISARWGSGGVRVTSYLLQAAACVVAVLSGAVSVRTPLPLAAAFSAAVIAGLSLLQYRWCRTHKPIATNSAYFSWLDKEDYSAVVLLLAGLLSGFCFAQLGLYEVLDHLMTDFEYPFRSGQSIFINFGAVLLMFLALKEKNIEIIIVAGVVTFIGAVKVFIFDLFWIKGLPLVISVFSFGVVAAIASVIMGRWQKRVELKIES